MISGLATKDSFSQQIDKCGMYPLLAEGISTLQVNVGKKCNLQCKHCHVEAGPDRPETMSRQTAHEVIRVLADSRIRTLDITGGAPELNEQLPYLLKEGVSLGKEVIVRSNLTVLAQPAQEYLLELYKRLQITIMASLPCYRVEEVDDQRGKGVYDSSIAMLKRLNNMGYGKDESLRLDLVFNPLEAFLPDKQEELEEEYKQQLLNQHGIVFNHLYTITNVPIGRFKKNLVEQKQLMKYKSLLINSFNSATVPPLMCRRQISVSWDGYLYDCDFNQMLNIKCMGADSIADFDYEKLAKRQIALDEHCFACTAGSGSSCGGSLV